MSTTYMVTGSAGFIGSALSRRLLSEGHRVVGVDAFTDSYSPTEKLDRALELCRHSGYSQLVGDLTELRLAEHLEEVEAVFHMAGRPGVRPSFALTDLYVHDNVDATRALLQAASSAPSVRRLVYASSSSVYGNAPLPLRESAGTAPVSPYGQTKLDAELLCLGAAGPRLETVALRYFTVYGPGQRPDMAFRRFCEAAVRGETIHVYGDGSQSRDFTFVDDIVEATLRALESPVDGLPINVGGGSRVTLVETLDILAELASCSLSVVKEGEARGDVRHTAADLSRAQELLHFAPRIPVRQGLEAELSWVRGRVAASAGRVA